MQKKIGYVLPFFIFLFLFFLKPVNATQTFDYTYDIADARTYQATATQNYGTTTSLGVYNNTGSETRTYMKWNVSYLYGTNITDANLSLYLFSGDNNLNIEILYNTTDNWTETNITWNNQTALGTWISNTSVSTKNAWYNFSITDALKDAVNNNKNLNLVITYPSYYFYSLKYYYSKEYANTTFRPYLSVSYNATNSSTCGDCGYKENSTECFIPPIVGSYCESGLLKNVPYANCTGTTYYACPEFTYCSQITPAINVSEYLSQSAVGMLDWCRGCWFINYRPDPIFHYNQLAIFATNCYDRDTLHIYTECNCNQIGNCSSDVYETTNITDVPYSITQWSAGCFNPSTGKYANVLNATGQNTTIEDMVNETCGLNCTLTNNVTSNCEANTTTTCYDSNCNIVQCKNIVSATCGTSAGGQAALAVGGMMGITDCGLSQNIIALLGSLIVGCFVLYYTRDSNQSAMAFIVGTLATLVMFTLVSWFPAWVIIILIVISSYIVAKSLGVGGGA